LPKQSLDNITYDQYISSSRLLKKSGENFNNMHSHTRSEFLINLNIRNYQPGDFEKYGQLYNNDQEFQEEASCISPQSLGEVLFSPRCTPNKDILLVLSEEEIIGLGYLIPEPEIDRVILRWIIHPRYRRKGVGLALLKMVLDRVHQLGVSSIQSDVDEKNQSVRELLVANNFKKVRVFHEMRLKISEQKFDYSFSAKQKIDYLKKGQEGLLTEVQNLCFNGSWGYHPNNEDEVTYCLSLKKCSYADVLIIYEKEKPAGFCWLTINPELPTDRNRKIGRIHMMGITPTYRQAGLGRSLLIAGLSHLLDKGINNVELTVDSANRNAFQLYRSVGFKVYSNTDWYERRLK
jgi:mycothiol synthase